MNKRKIFTALGVGIVLLVMLAALGNSTPRTPGQFIKNYNNAIRNSMNRHVAGKDVDSYVRRCSINEYTKNFNGVRANFTGYAEPKPAFMFEFAEDVSADEVFGIIDAAIEAVGDDYKKVDEALGILKGTNYNIRNGYQNDITLNGKEYLLEWVGGSIHFIIVITK